MEHYPFETFNGLLNCLKPVDLLAASASLESRTAFEERFSNELNDLKLQVFGLAAKASSKDVVRCYVCAYQDNLCLLIQQLSAELKPGEIAAHFEQKKLPGYSSFIITLLFCVRNGYEGLCNRFDTYLDGGKPSLLFTRTAFFYSYAGHLSDFLAKLEKRVHDERLKEIIKGFMHSYGNGLEDLPFQLADRWCFVRIWGALIPVLDRRGKEDMSQQVMLELMMKGFNTPEFINYCIEWMDRTWFNPKAGHQEMLEQVHQLETFVGSLGGNYLKLSALDSLHARCRAWLDDLTKLWQGEEQFELAVHEGVLAWINDIRLHVSLSVRLLGMALRCLVGAAVIMEKDMRKVQEFGRMMFITVHNGDNPPSKGSLENSFFSTDEKTAATLIAIFENCIKWLRSKTRLGDDLE